MITSQHSPAVRTNDGPTLTLDCSVFQNRGARQNTVSIGPSFSALTKNNDYQVPRLVYLIEKKNQLINRAFRVH